MGKRKNPVPISIFSFITSCLYFSSSCEAANSISQGKSITDGETIISTNGKFALGFFSPGNSSSRFAGIWYNQISVKSIVWVANREKPIFDETGFLKIGDDGNFMVLDGNGVSIWSTNVSVSSINTTIVLNDNGDLFLSGSSDGGHTNRTYWQSFNNPTDTYLPGMKVRVNTAMGENRCFSSWKSVDDPSPGNFTMGVDPRGSPQIVVWEGENRRWRSGQWNQQIFTGVPNMTSNYLYGFKLSPHDEDGSMYFTYVPSNREDLLRFLINWNGVEEELRWLTERNEWFVYQSQPANECEIYNKCGNFGVCSVKSSPICNCLRGFVPKNSEQWDKGNWSGGCVRKTELQCQSDGGGDYGFLGVKWVKLPDFADQVVAEGNTEACEDECRKNCSCNAYAHADGIGCLVWTEELVDVQNFGKIGETLYIRLAGSELGQKKLPTVIIILIVIAGTVFIGIFLWLLWRFRTQIYDCPKVSLISRGKNNADVSVVDVTKSGEFSTEVSGPVVECSAVDGTELQLYSFKSVAAATDNFSEDNELGKGGFGPVYKGKFPGGQDIAVKRLSRMSGQGVEEFKNEIILIAKLQHINLVRLLGCCIEGEEKMLLYEYMPNKSLDGFLFDPANQAKLDWPKRFTIIEGIARGLLYLHRDSRLRIIHRDLKASNILLDENMNPKISDFGMARIFGGNQNDEANTIRVVGTYGYMSPEYAMEGLFSVKSDVYSFGVLLLEIVSGRRNTSFRLSEHLSLIGYAWNLWNEDRAIDLVDPAIGSSCLRYEVLRCIQVGMLCVQDSATLRPTMSAVVLMLETDTATIPLPRQPTFTSMRSSIDTEFITEHQDLISSSDMTVTSVAGR